MLVFGPTEIKKWAWAEAQMKNEEKGENGEKEKMKQSIKKWQQQGNIEDN